jgi:carbon monoxide dehydrogenase subunit G
MKLDNTFTVTAPIDKVWATLMDFEQVAGCVPGAQVLNKLSEDAYQVGMKVKLGPVTMQYKGQLDVLERDPAGHRAVLHGQAKEARGQGTAEATAHVELIQDGADTHGTIHADVNLSGRVAAMGQGVIGTVTDQMMEQFTRNLQTMLTEPEPELAAEAGPELASEPAGIGTPSDTVVTARAVSGLSPASHFSTPASKPATEEAAQSSLDAVALAKAVAVAQLREPRKALGLLAIVAVLAYLLGRRSART